MTVQSPIPDFAAARSAMVESQLRPEGVTDRAVLAAMGSVAREQFVPPRSGRWPMPTVRWRLATGDICRRPRCSASC